jgi:hypothetical protein
MLADGGAYRSIPVEPGFDLDCSAAGVRGVSIFSRASRSGVSPEIGHFPALSCL